MRHASFVEENKEPGEESIFSPTIGKHFDSVFIQVTLETYLTPKFQEWLTHCIFSRLTPECDGVRIAIVNKFESYN